MGFQQGLSGLDAATTQLNVIGNNIANAETVGFKGSRAEFGDMFVSSLYSVSSTQVGIGVQTEAITASTSQGDISPTQRSLDLAISNNGYFVMRTKVPFGSASGGSSSTTPLAYSRNGQFQIDPYGFINNNGNRLQGWMASADGVITQGAMTDLQIVSESQAPNPTSLIQMPINLDSRAASIATGTVVDPTNPATYTWSNAATVFDSLGNQHVLTLYYSKNPPTAGGTNWTVTAYVDNNLVGANPSTYALSFGTNGTLNSAQPALNISYNALTPNGASFPQTFQVSYGAAGGVTGPGFSSTQFASNSATNGITNDGYPPGTLQGININQTGVVQATYSNNQTATLGQLALATFTNQQGLQPMGDTLLGETLASGNPQYNAPGSGPAGQIQASALEDANIELTNELVNMITAQRFYQANAQTIRTENEITQTVINLR